MGYDIERNEHCPAFKNPRQYAEAKMKILREEFCLNLTREEELHLLTLPTQISIDNAFLSIINHHWDK